MVSGHSLAPAYLRASVEASLERLNLHTVGGRGRGGGGGVEGLRGRRGRRGGGGGVEGKREGFRGRREGWEGVVDTSPS